ncbi:unnamed protein product [Caenorhabditis sp. 36 PRJEB53466]|nr:unnamed protein product [Caenorhabditis sp. 36 PRJEB53466]
MMRRTVERSQICPSKNTDNICPREFNRCLRRLYPSIREKEDNISLPRCWDSNQASSYLELSQNGLSVSFKKNVSLQGDKDPSGVVRADAPIPSSIGLYYFEVTIVHGHRGCMGVGLSKTGGELNRMPGWDSSCYGYHGDDGNFFSACGHGTAYGPKFGTGDVIGCGIDTLLREIFFTKNGKHLGTALKGNIPFEELYPTVGLKTPGEQIHVNFGQVPFVFNISNYSAVLIKRKIETLESIAMPEDVRQHTDRIVSSFLGECGAMDSLEKFENVAKIQQKMNYEFLRKRKEIIEMILNAAHGSSIQANLENYFPNCLSANPRVQLVLLCLRYIDLANTLREPPASFKKPISEAGQTSSPSNVRVANSKFRINTRHKSYKRTRHDRSSSPISVSASTRKSADLHESSVDAKNASTDYYSDDDTGECMMTIDGISITKRMYTDLLVSNELDKMCYIMKMGREIMKLSKEFTLTQKERQILEIAMTMVLTTSPIEKHPLSSAHRRYIANLVMTMINHEQHLSGENGTSGSHRIHVYSELRGMFMGWQTLHTEAMSQDHPVGAISFLRDVAVYSKKFEEDDVDYSDEPMEEGAADDIQTEG